MVGGAEHGWGFAQVTANSQGELDPLEIGIHAFEAVPVAKGGRGKKGGLSEYAERIGKTKQNISILREAGEVVGNCQVDLTVFLGKSQHLAAIHKMPKSCWQSACEWLVKANESVVDIKERVEAALSAEPVPSMFGVTRDDSNQLGRRNLHPDQMSLLRGRIYNRSKKTHGGDRKSSPQNEDLKTAQKIADKHGVSKATIKRDGKFAEAARSTTSMEGGT